MNIESLSKLLSSLASLIWPVIFIIIIVKFYEPLKQLLESARERRFTIKVAGNELTMEEASEQQRRILSDVQSKIVEIEKRQMGISPVILERPRICGSKRILWVDDLPKNNSFLIASIEEKGIKVDTAFSTGDGLKKFGAFPYDIVVSDMARSEGQMAGIDLAKEIRALKSDVPFFILCGDWAAENLRDEALKAGVTEITSSSTTLLGQLLL